MELTFEKLHMAFRLLCGPGGREFIEILNS